MDRATRRSCSARARERSCLQSMVVVMVVRVRLGSTDACASSGYGLANETKATSVAKQSSGVWQSKKSNLLHPSRRNSENRRFEE